MIRRENILVATVYPRTDIESKQFWVLGELSLTQVWILSKWDTVPPYLSHVAIDVATLLTDCIHERFDVI